MTYPNQAEMNFADSGNTYLIHQGTIILTKSHRYCKCHYNFIFPFYIHYSVDSLVFFEQLGVIAMQERP